MVDDEIVERSGCAVSDRVGVYLLHSVIGIVETEVIGDVLEARGGGLVNVCVEVAVGIVVSPAGLIGVESPFETSIITCRARRRRCRRDGCGTCRSDGGDRRELGKYNLAVH